MGLTLKPKTTKLQVFKRGFSTFSEKSLKMIKEDALSFILVLLMLLNIFTNLRIELVIFIVLYFADRWQIKRLILGDQVVVSEEKK